MRLRGLSFEQPPSRLKQGLDPNGMRINASMLEVGTPIPYATHPQPLPLPTCTIQKKHIDGGLPRDTHRQALGFKKNQNDALFQHTFGQILIQSIRRRDHRSI